MLMIMLIDLFELGFMGKLMFWKILIQKNLNKQ